MPEDVLEKLSSAIGRQVKPASSGTTAARPKPVYTAGEKVQGLSLPGNIDINDRPIVPNPAEGQGKSSTVLSTSIEMDGKHILIPRVSDGADGKPPHVMGKEEAFQYYKKTKKHLGIFNSDAEADAYGKHLHEQQEKLKNVNGRTSAEGPNLESVIGRKVTPAANTNPMFQQRFKIYGDARKNGMDPDKAAKTAVASGTVMGKEEKKGPWDEFKQRMTSPFGFSEEEKRTLERIPIGPGVKKTFGDVGNDIAPILHRLWSGPFLGTVDDKQWEKIKQAQTDYFQGELKKTLAKQGEPKTALDKFRAGAAKFDAGAIGGLAEFAEGMTSPGQVALMVETFGTSSLYRGAAALGIKEALPAAKTLGKLMQLHFAASMLEGAATGIENTFRSTIDGDWEGAGKSAIEGLISGVMAKSIGDHEVASARVRQDLEKVAREKYGVPKGSPLVGSITSRFDQLNPFDQGMVIDETVKRSPEYTAVLNDVDANSEATRGVIKKGNERKLSEYYGQTLREAWNPDVARRTMDGLRRADELNEKASIDDGIKAVREQFEKQRQESVAGYFASLREKRVPRQQEAASGRSEVGRVVSSLAEKRDELWKQRNETRQDETSDVPQREVDSIVAEDGGVAYPAHYWGEENTFGVAGDLSGQAIYRQTPRGVEWMDAEGNFDEEPASLYSSPDPETADTVARLQALGAQTSTLADAEGATPEHVRDADLIADIRRSLVSGEIDAKEAQRRAGIAEKTSLPDEYAAARDGRLNGPFHESSPNGYYDGLREEAQSAGMSEEETNALLDESGLLARQQTEGNLNHVYRPGDYITSKRGVKWTLDAKGMLHPDDGGQPMPLMRRGLYSNSAMQLAESGRVGYGLKTREERRVDDARRRNTIADIRNNQEQIDREMRLAAQREGLTPASADEPRGDSGEKRDRQERIMSRPPRPESPVDAIVKLIFKAPTDAKSVIHSIAARQGVSDEEVMRLQLASDPERSTTTQARVARLEVGDSISDDFRKDRPWKVEQGKDGQLYIRSGNASPLKLDRLNPSDRVNQLVEKGVVTSEKPEFTEKDINRAAFDVPHYFSYQDDLAEQVKERRDGKAKDPEPRTPVQAKVQAQAAERRNVAATSVATRAVVEALEPDTTSVEKAEAQAEEANEKVKVAEESYNQLVQAEAKTVPADTFPPRAPATIGYRGSAGVIVQNGREVPFHYELLPLNSLLSSHDWQGRVMVENEQYSVEAPGLQPRTVSERESQQNALRAERRFVDQDSGRASGYNFAEYADRTVGGTTGPAIIDSGGRVVGGNTRLSIMRRHLDNLKAIGDAEEREAALLGFKAAMRRAAQESGINGYPEDGGEYALVRMMDKPIETTREAAELGRLFNKPVSVQIAKSARGVSYAKSLDKPIMEDIARRVDGYDGLIPAMQADPEFFRDIVTNRFGVEPEEFVDWFDDVPGRGLVLNEQGRSQFSKVLMGTVIKDTATLNRIEGKTPYRALERALGYMVKMQALPERDIIGKITEAAQASGDTMDTDPALSASNDKWLATYHPDQTQLMGMETDTPPEPDRMVEAIWRALHASNAAVPRAFSDRLKSFIGDESSAAMSMFEEKAETPAEAFNRTFSRELTEVKYSRRDKTEGITQEEFDQSLKNREMSDVERAEAEEAGKGGRGESPELSEGGVEAPPTVKEMPVAAKRMERPPAPPKKASPAEKILAETKAANGYLTSTGLREILETNESTKNDAPQLFRVARMMAEYVFDADPPVGVDRKQALDWVLKERLAGIEAGELKSKRGEYNDPNLAEKGMADSIMRLHKAADASTFIHEFAHVIFPMLSDEDLKAIDTIRGEKGHVWDGTRKGLEGKSYRDLSEKLAHGLEQFLRDENPTGFTHEVKAVLAKIKEMMKKVYLKFKGDPLSTFENTEESREVFSKMFGIKDFDVRDQWREEVKKAKAEANKMKRPEDEPHPLQRQASDAGAVGIRSAFSGKVEDSVGDRIDPRKPVAVFVFPDADKAAMYYSTVATAGSKLDSAELVAGEDGTYGVRFNTKTKLPSSILSQALPEKHPGVELEEVKKKLLNTPASTPMLRKLLQLKIQNLENEIRAKYGAEVEEPVVEADTAKKTLEEVKNGRTDEVRKGVDAIPGVPPARGFAGISKPPTPPKTSNAAAGLQRVRSDGRSVARVPTSLADVKPVALEPLRTERGQAVGTVVGEAFDKEKWQSALRIAGLPEHLPPPTWALDRKTAAKLIFPGQPEIAATALSALEQGDGAVVASATGTGKTYTSMAIAKEWKARYPDSKILVITKNASLLKSTQDVATNTFGFDVDKEMPERDAPTGVYGTTYARMIRSDAAKNTKWDLVLTDESGEARNWFKEENKQGKALIDVTANAKKAVYFSATPFHSPMEYGYLTKLNLWPKNGFDKWIEGNFAHEKVDDKIIAKLDPGKQAKLRQQLIERGQLISQAISYDGFTAHFGVVPVTDQMKRGLDRIREGFARAKKQLVDMKRKGLAEKVAAFEATYTKAFLERERLPQAIELAKRARQNGWQVVLFSETSSEDLFRREVGPDDEMSTYQQLDAAMGGQLAKIIPPFGDVYDQLRSEFGSEIVDYSGRGNSMAEREKAKSDFLAGEAPMLYTTYAAGGIGVSLHDADYPDRGIKGGDKPRIAVFLGPPYSGVLLEQSMGRLWRFGVKSDTHAVFLATDSDPDIRLMQQKVGPRMRALRASVLGERDSLASVMSTYTDEEKVRARQEALAYQEGNESEVTAASYQVRSKSRNVGINEWSSINFPPAESAKNKGMKYGADVPGGDWSTLYQSKFGLQPPDSSKEETFAKQTVDAMGNGLASGKGLPEGVSVQNLDPADRDVVVGAASAVATDSVEDSANRDQAATARQTMQSQMNLPGEKDKWILTFPEGKKFGVWKYTGDPEDLAGTKSEGPERPKDIRTWYLGNMFSQEVGIRTIAKRAGNLEAGENIVRMNRSYQADTDMHFADFSMGWQDIMRNLKLDIQDKKLMSELWDTVEGKRTTDNPYIQQAANKTADLMERIHDAIAGADVKLKTPAGETISWKDISKDRRYMPHRIDWKAKVEDPLTGEVHILEEVMKETFAQASRRRIIEAIAKDKGYTYDQVVDYLKAYAPGTPVLGHVNRARTMNFPFIMKDSKTLMAYFRQAADSIAIEKNFGSERSKLDKEIARIPSENGRRTVKSMFDGLLEPQEWEDISAQVYNAAIAFEAATKMTISVTKVPFHLAHVPVGMKGRVKPMMRAMLRTALHPKEVMENATYVGTIARQLNAADLATEGGFGAKLTHGYFELSGFNSAYKVIRAIAGESSRIWMEQYAMRELRHGNAGETRRLLRDVMLVGDKGIDEAIANGRFAPEDMKKAQIGFANLATWSNNPLQMPGWARLHIAKSEATTTVGLKRAVRLTYALQSFALKTTSLLREQLWDEAMIHGNYKPLAYAIVAYPIIGQMLAGTGAGAKHVVKKSLEGYQGKKHEEDSWDKWLADMEDTFENPTAVKFLKFWVDGFTLGVAWDRTRRIFDPFLNLAEGKNKQAGEGFHYMVDNEISQEIGGAFNDVWDTLKLGAQAGEIEAGTGDPAKKPAKVEKAVDRYVDDVVPILRQVPGMTAPPKKPAQTSTRKY